MRYLLYELAYYFSGMIVDCINIYMVVKYLLRLCNCIPGMLLSSSTGHPLPHACLIAVFFLNSSEFTTFLTEKEKNIFSNC